MHRRHEHFIYIFANVAKLYNLVIEKKQHLFFFRNNNNTSIYIQSPNNDFAFGTTTATK